MVATLAGDGHLLPDGGAGGEGKGASTLRTTALEGNQGEPLPPLPESKNAPHRHRRESPWGVWGDHAHHRSHEQTTGHEGTPAKPPPGGAPRKNTQFRGSGRKAEEGESPGKGGGSSFSPRALLELVHVDLPKIRKGFRISGIPGGFP